MTIQSAPVRILLLNPNCSEAMTSAMAASAAKLPISASLQIQPYTAPSSAPASINDDGDVRDSTACVSYDMTTAGKSFLQSFDAILVSCFSVHSLVEELRPMVDAPVLGIFEASILTALSVTAETDQWGIVTTGQFWEKHLNDGVNVFLGQQKGDKNDRFAGTFSSGLNAGDFHTVSPDEVKQKLKEATKNLLKAGNVTCVVMGCGGMAGLEDIIRTTTAEVKGEEAAKELFIIDGVQAGVLQLHQTIQSKRAFR